MLARLRLLEAAAGSIVMLVTYHEQSCIVLDDESEAALRGGGCLARSGYLVTTRHATCHGYEPGTCFKAPYLNICIAVGRT